MADVVVLVITRRCKCAPRFGVGERWHVLGQAVCLRSFNSEVLNKLGVLWCCELPELRIIMLKNGTFGSDLE